MKSGIQRLCTPLLVVAGLAAAPAYAATPATEPQGESVLTLRVDGTLTISPRGDVTDFRIRTPLEPELQALLKRAVPTWRFKPILLDGKPVAAKSPMRITLAATEVPQGYKVRLDNVVFLENTAEEIAEAAASQKAHPGLTVAGEPPRARVEIVSKRMDPPKYPVGMQRTGAEGVVLLNLRLNPDGTVAEVFAAQSSLLSVKGGGRLLDRGRAMLERNASLAAQRWTFTVTTPDASALKPEDLTIRVPVEYATYSSDGAVGLEGKWRHEFRGPNLTAPWLPPEDAKVGVSDLNSNEMVAGMSPFELSDRSVLGKAL